jgi:hypothetical protein
MERVLADIEQDRTPVIWVRLARSTVVSFRPAVFDRHILALDITGFGQSAAESVHHGRVSLRRRAVQKSDHRHCRLLRACRERQCRRAAKQRDEVASSHSIELHLVPCQPGLDARISNWQGSVSGVMAGTYRLTVLLSGTPTVLPGKPAASRYRVEPIC